MRQHKDGANLPTSRRIMIAMVIGVLAVAIPGVDHPVSFNPWIW
jgi:hypothetical protein